ncbi:Transposable element P transposase [Frankliniella fusca]|uniref:Transposable element P transposase n=1 Tax=Frankliniella fusca TaxID=407009 RepID=A0AAE1HK33_9NEOP|nr:Transposable element P transposase [Frankliniella fusca]
MIYSREIMEKDKDNDKPKPAPKPRGGARKVSARKRVKRPKQRGKYKQAVLGVNDPDLVDCLFSDDDVRAEYFECHIPESNNLILQSNETEMENAIDSSDVDNTSTSSCTTESSAVSSNDSRSSSVSDSLPPTDINSRPPSSSESRPSSSFSFTADSPICDRPSSAMESRPSSAASNTSKSSTVSKSAVMDFSITLGAVNPLENLTSEGNETPPNNVLLEALNRFKAILPRDWLSVADKIGFHLLFLSPFTPKSVLKEIVLFYNGNVSVFIQSGTVISRKVLVNFPVPSLLSNGEASVKDFCDKGLKILNVLMDFHTCVGVNSDSKRKFWSCIPNASVDKYVCDDSFAETCRSNHCEWLLKKKMSKCSSCKNVEMSLNRKVLTEGAGAPAPSTRNDQLTHSQALLKLSLQADAIRKRDKKISYLEKRVQDVLDKEGVDIDKELSDDFQQILESSSLSDVQKLFMKEQMARSKLKDVRSHRWHPTMIRFALFVRDKAGKSGYAALRDTGAIALPSERTLFDYSHSFRPQEGVSDGILKIVCEKVKKLNKSYQKYHNLLCDEMYISKNLVYRQSDGTLVGYSHLDEVEKELQNFESHVEHLFTGKSEKTELQLAKTMLAFLVKGVASDVKFVVASYPMLSLTGDMLYVRAWQVISKLERAGVKVLSFVCDHAPNNRAFLNMHQPLTKLKSGVVFDTYNFCSPEGRPLFLIADVCHLLKTIRNCFYNSGEGEKKTRCLQINGEKIVWKTIVRLYMTFKDCNFRKSFKLNAQNVFPNPFSCMRVRYAAQVLSDTVALDIEDQKWPGTTETVRFIRYCNKFFDTLNGAYAEHHIRIKNKNLAPYRDVNDVRFAWLGVPLPGHELQEGKSFLKYLQDWKDEVEALPLSRKQKDKMTLCWQTVTGIKRSIHAIAGAIRFLLQLEEPAKFINARVFSQDPLEQHFSLQSMGRGGSRNPNAFQFGNKRDATAQMREMGSKLLSGNTESLASGMAISDEPLPKRPRNSKKRK